MKLKTTTTPENNTNTISEDGLLRIRIERDFNTKMSFIGKTDEQVVWVCKMALAKERKKKRLEQLCKRNLLTPERFLAMKMVSRK